MAGTSSSTIASYRGYQERSVIGAPLQLPPEGSGLMMQPTKPSSSTQRRSSPTVFAGDTPGDCGSWQAPTKFCGYSEQMRWTRLLDDLAQAAAVPASPRWWAMR